MENVGVLRHGLEPVGCFRLSLLAKADARDWKGSSDSYLDMQTVRFAGSSLFQKHQALKQEPTQMIV